MTDTRIMARPRRNWAKAGLLAALIFFLLDPAPLIGDSVQAQGLKDYELAKIRAALELQELRMSEENLARLSRSIVEESKKNSLDPLLVMAIIEVESRFDHRAVSPQGALGLMQVQPVAAAALAAEEKITPAEKPRKLNLKDPAVNVQIGASYLAHLKDMFGDLKTALTAYNAGPTWVSRMLAAKQALPLGYATKVLAARHSLETRLARLEIVPGGETSDAASG